ncbi:Transmembrane component NikQ of energizing module of nickel ECF transporter [Methanocaldococcus lauensis]|uniref:Transmembrane component NikQ of energizing module of nickel ECF transporter n=1 Tax=Methanocaldococcus lauensis TaxID=2546128 RepID=A0A8D6PWU3_9EURY|nr:Transmembrane component NikQ of energizing module of nickel ECF transporter [Methanocaldococcus lauensis]
MVNSVKLINKTVEHVIKYISEAVFSEKFARNKDGFLQKLDPRIKIIGLIILVITTVSIKHIEVLIFLYLLSLIFCILSRIPLLYYIKRVWLFIPLFTGIIIFPVIFLTPGHPIYVILKKPYYIAITYEGIKYAVLFTLRVATAISYTVLITLTTRWDEIMKALNSLGVPDIVITIMTLAYRYIFLLLNNVLEMMYSKKSRLCRNLKLKESWIIAGKSMGALFIKTQRMGEDIYYAMLSRGYLNEPRIFTNFKVKYYDIIFLCFIVLISSISLGYDRLIL